MGLFDKIKKTAGDARSQFDTAKFSAEKMAGEVTGAEDARPFAPNEVLVHQQQECVKVSGTRYHQDALAKLPGDAVMVAIGKAKSKDWDAYPVTMLNGEMLGALSDYAMEKGGFEPGANVVAEIHRPTYQFEDHIALYVPRTPEAIAAQKAREAMTLWVNLDASKWEIEQGERFEFPSGEIVTQAAEGKKPVYIVTGEGRRLFVVNSRMKMHADIGQRAGYPIRKLIAERKDGDYGPYYRVGFYY